MVIGPISLVNGHSVCILFLKKRAITLSGVDPNLWRHPVIHGPNLGKKPILGHLCPFAWPNLPHAGGITLKSACWLHYNLSWENKKGINCQKLTLTGGCVLFASSNLNQISNFISNLEFTLILVSLRLALGASLTSSHLPANQLPHKCPSCSYLNLGCSVTWILKLITPQAQNKVMDIFRVMFVCKMTSQTYQSNVQV